MNYDVLLTFNAGSSSLKIGVFEIGSGTAHSTGRAKIDFETSPLRLVGKIGGLAFERELFGDPESDFGEVVNQVIDHLDAVVSGRITAAAHRVVHGGIKFDGPVLIGDKVLDDIESLVHLAPLHQPAALRVIRAVRESQPEIAQTASFDTAFHASQADVVRRLAIPRAMHDDGVRRYGFHGLSYAYIARALEQIAPQVAAGRVVACHLGSGASVCGMIGGRSRDTSMGFSALDGIPMATRPGWIDPGALLYLMRKGMRQPERIEQFLYHECGLLGVSGISGDTRVLLKDPSHEATEAIDLFCLRVAGEISRQATTLGGLDAVVFTAGVGENQPEIRGRVAERLGWLGLELDDGRNEANSQIISTTDSSIKVFVIPTDEEQVIADEALSVLSHHKL
ncbi:acetate/propionate family kinase [Rhizobium sp. S163]|uniref:acetate/propionate family kinase n=1 Tax=Rhizobium sp. S163 TaxID=3055039 RepID=UPI0025A95C92|nr:acetate/propionate family kinase [Rhizobium sp. S163]MDM9644820.1 acetate/propionate family kinase [Rhizobium sp. S163]